MGGLIPGQISYVQRNNSLYFVHAVSRKTANYQNDLRNDEKNIK